MGRNDTITYAVTPCAGHVTPSTASVFRAVNKDGFGAQNSWGCEETCAGSWSGKGSNCNNGCDSCGWAQVNNNCDKCNTWNNGNDCDTCNGNNRNTWNHSGKNRNNGCNSCGCVQANNDCNECNSCNDCNDCDTCNGNNRNAWNRSGKNRSNGCNSCGWAQANNDCDQCNSCNDCDNCDTCNSHTRNRSGKGRTPAMVYEEEHQLCKMHELEEAIRKGTLFSELYMPMNGESADACGAQLCKGQAEAFAIWELRLYLNTHPCDQQALQLLKKIDRKACQPNYASAFAFEEGCDDRWSWTDAPWPWEFNCNCE